MSQGRLTIASILAVPTAVALIQKEREHDELAPVIIRGGKKYDFPGRVGS